MKKTVKKIKIDFSRVPSDMAFIYDDTTNAMFLKYFIRLTNEFPSSVTFEQNIQKERIDDLCRFLTKKYKLARQQFFYSCINYDFSKLTEKDQKISDEFIIAIEPNIWVFASEEIGILYSHAVSFSKIHQLIQDIRPFLADKRGARKKFNMIVRDAELSLKEFEMRQFSMNIRENYNDSFLNVNAIIEDFLGNPTANGLILLHGKPGTGKTTYIRHLIANVNAKFIYFPVDFLNSIDEPNFIPFISKYPGSVLVIEDCEKAIMSREHGNASMLLSNLLNLGDGLLSDALKLKIICTFNSNLRNIDKALLRKGRLIARYEFDNLETKKANLLAKKLNLNITYDSPQNLADIYGSGTPDFTSYETKRIGFSQPEK